MYLQLLFLILVANGSPIIVRGILKNHWATPIDGGTVFLDGLPILGSSKTFRGVVFAILATSLVALVMGLSWEIGMIVSAWGNGGRLSLKFYQTTLAFAFFR